ncbi:MAG: primosomal protein N' [Bacteroidaceae bacterium]|nr:primosomal protein N' [Bacteroidaceae bacterium]
MHYVDVILPLPLQDTYTYAITDQMHDSVSRGCRVVVQFGKKKVYTAIVTRVHNEPPPFEGVKYVTEVLENHPIVNERQMQLWEWIANYYLCPIGDVYKAALPGGLKPKDDSALREKNKRRRLHLDSSFTLGESTILRPLSPAQQTAYDDILTSFTDHDTTLLHGVTSSGKTEIYIHLIEHYIAQGKQVLYLLPEIALTTQITDRLEAVFGDDMGVYHSKFTDAQRVAVYQKQLSDSPYRLILGVRSSVFLPFQDLGLVIVDEEHEQSYKQQEPAPRYHARSAALILARMFGAKTLLGTATPSFEVYHFARKGRYGYVQLTQRYQGMQLPDIHIVDIKELKRRKQMIGAFSPQLVDAIREALARREQVILFHNRRGFSHFIECKQCGWVPRCSHCDVSLTYHKKTLQLTCHYCGYTYRLPDTCPACGEKNFMSKGVGTEKVEDQIAEIFPEASVLRMDLDTTRSRNSYEQIINDFADHKADILIGTQMVTKGLDFDNVSIVGILDADTMMNQPDFRAYERTFQTLSQVAGRAGRKNHTGQVFLQTKSADSPTIQHVVANRYWDLFYTQMLEREQFHYPPFHRLIYVYLRHKDAQLLDHLAAEMADRLRAVFGARVLGPDTPPVSRVQSLYIRKIMIKIENSASTDKVRQALLTIQKQMLNQPVANALSIYYDVDPL